MSGAGGGAKPGSLPGRGLRLDGQRALVTGAGRGIGLACAEALAEAGAEVTLLSRTRSELEQAAGEIGSAGGQADVLVCDCTDADCGLRGDRRSAGPLGTCWSTTPGPTGRKVSWK